MAWFSNIVKKRESCSNMISLYIYRIDSIYTSSRIVRVAAASGLAQEFWLVLLQKVKIRNGTSSVYSSLYGKLLVWILDICSYLCPIYISLCKIFLHLPWAKLFFSLFSMFCFGSFHLLKPINNDPAFKKAETDFPLVSTH